jgi:hypothetical protein
VRRTPAAGNLTSVDADLPARYVSAAMSEPAGRPVFESTLTSGLPDGAVKFGHAHAQTALAGRVEWVTVRMNAGPTLSGPALPQQIVDEVVGAAADWIYDGQAFAAFNDGADAALLRQRPLETLGALRYGSMPPTVVGDFTAVYGEVR